MTPKQAQAFADGLLTKTSHRYAVHYHAAGELHTCTVFPGATLADASVTGWPDDYELQGIVCRDFEAAVAADPNDGHLAIEPGKFAPTAESVGLTEEELAFASETEFQPNAVHQFDPALLEQWHAEDEAEADQDELLESHRAVTVELNRLAPRFGMLRREGFGPALAELSAMLAGDEIEFDAQRAEGLLASLSSFASSGY